MEFPAKAARTVPRVPPTQLVSAVPRASISTEGPAWNALRSTASVLSAQTPRAVFSAMPRSSWMEPPVRGVRVGVLPAMALLAVAARSDSTQMREPARFVPRAALPAHLPETVPSALLDSTSQARAVSSVSRCSLAASSVARLLVSPAMLPVDSS